MSDRAPSPQSTWDALFGDFYLRAYAGGQDGGPARDQALAAVRLGAGPEGGDVLDAPCGYGRHAVPLAQAGYRVTGVDRSRTLLDAAQAAAGDGPAPRLVEADYRELPLADASFDVALNLFSSLGYLGDAEDERVLGELHRVLRPGGRLVLETMHRDLLVRRFQESDWRLLGEGRLMLEQRTFDARAGVVQTTQTLIETDGRRESRSWSVRVYAATELVAMLERAGFDEVRCLGDLHGAPLRTDTRLVVAATKR
jgi:SAM-dependent methyltransferase